MMVKGKMSSGFFEGTTQQRSLYTYIKESAMSSGAFALYIDQVAGGGSGAMIRRVIPLPPTSGGDAINFNQGRLSLAYDDFGSSLPAIVNVRIINTTGVRLSTTLTLSPGRTLVSDIQADDLLASFEVGSGTPRPALTALVEYSD
jgi:hypothetical protein